MIEDNKASNAADNLEAQLSGDTVPEKFRGKSIKDVLTSYKELETAHSRQGQELGETRRLAASLAELETRSSKPEPSREPVTTDDLLTDPEKAISAAIETHPAVKAAQERSEVLERQIAINTFEKRHPSFRDDMQDPEFKQWVETNPAVRKIAAQADGYDMDAADTLFSLWGERKELKKQSTSRQEQDENKKKQERAGTLEGASGTDASAEKTYSRSEFRELHRRALLGDRTAKAKWEDPKFKELRRKAYLDGRVS